MQRDKPGEGTPGDTWKALLEVETEPAASGPAAATERYPDANVRLRSQRALNAALELVESRTVIKDRFLLEALLGVGGMGAVYKARDLRKVEARDRNPWIAIKLLNDEFRRHPQALISLQREARKAQVLTHPNVIQVFDFDRDGDRVFMTMELLQGQDISQCISEHPGGIESRKAFAFVESMARALEHAHDNGIIHADFSPRNVFLTDEGKIKVLDFGIAQAVALVESAGTDTDSTAFDPATLGGLTRIYAGRERLEGMAPVPADDLFGLGCIAYQLLAGAHPYKGHTVLEAQTLGIRPKRLDQLSARQWRALQRAMAPTRDERYPTVQPFLDDFLPRPGNLGRDLAIACGLLAAAGAVAYQQFRVEPPEPLTEISRDAQELERQVAAAQALLRAGRFEEARSHVDAALQIAPEDPGIAALQARISELERAHRDSLRAQQALGERMAQLQRSADAHILAGRLVRPEDASAYADYLEMMALDPDSDRGKLLFDRIVGLLRDAAMSATRRGDRETAQAAIADWRRISPDHPGLPVLQAELDALVAEQRDRQMAIDRLLARARDLNGIESAAERRRLFMKVLEMEPVNSAARAGVEQADRDQAQLASQRAREQALRDAWAKLNSAELLLREKPDSVESFEAAYSQLLQAKRLAPDLQEVDRRIEGLYRAYRTAIERRIEAENYLDADRFLRSASVLNLSSEALTQLRKELDSLLENDEVVVPASF